ncbi:MAG: GNAT family N-acetyltransferase [Pyrinomonadaceae bacterium]
MQIIETERLILRELSAEDAEFVLELVNEPAWKKNIGDRGIQTTEGAREYILNGPVASYEKFGFGLWLVELKDSNESIGICGLIKRDTLEDVDIGFAFLERFWLKGYAVESAAAVMDYGRDVIGLKRIVAITVPDNLGSIKVLEKIGMRFEKMIRTAQDAEEIKLFARDF